MIWAVLLCGVAVCGSAHGALAQAGTLEPIRVESNDVLVPVTVVDKRRVDRLREIDSRRLFNEMNDGDLHAWEDLTVRDLAASNFQVYEDGQRQQIQ